MSRKSNDHWPTFKKLSCPHCMLLHEKEVVRFFLISQQFQSEITKQADILSPKDYAFTEIKRLTRFVYEERLMAAAATRL